MVELAILEPLIKIPYKPKQTNIIDFGVNSYKFDYHWGTLQVALGTLKIITSLFAFLLDEK